MPATSKHVNNRLGFLNGNSLKMHDAHISTVLHISSPASSKSNGSKLSGERRTNCGPKTPAEKKGGIPAVLQPHLIQLHAHVESSKSFQSVIITRTSYIRSMNSLKQQSYNINCLFHLLSWRNRNNTFKNTVKYFAFQNMLLKNNTTLVPVTFAVNSGELTIN